MADRLLVGEGGAQERQRLFSLAPADKGAPIVPPTSGFAVTVLTGAEQRQRLLERGSGLYQIAEGGIARPERAQGVAFNALVALLAEEAQGACACLDRLFGLAQG